MHVRIIRSLVTHYANDCVHVHVDVNVLGYVLFFLFVSNMDRFRIFLEGPFALWCFTGYELKEVNARHPSETAMFLKSYRNCPTKTTILISYFLEVIKKVSCFKAFTKNRQKRCLGEGVFSCCGEGLARFSEKIMLWSTFCGGTHTERGPQHDFFEKTSRALGQNEI